MKSPSPLIIEAKEWKKGISLLELVQSKKKLLKTNVLIKPLFDILKFCLDQEEQTSFEYTKQLVLGCLLDCCKKISTDDSENVSENNLNVELVVQCLRASPNPQTHHHALMLLSYLSAVIPVRFSFIKRTHTFEMFPPSSISSYQSIFFRFFFLEKSDA